MQTEQSESEESNPPQAAAALLALNDSDQQQQQSVHLLQVPQGGGPALQQSQTMLCLTRRDSTGSVRSLMSYPQVRDSLGKMHAYVDLVSKLDVQAEKQSFSKKHSGIVFMSEDE